jgi:uncharacterized protein YegL
MSGRPIEQLNAGYRALRQSIAEDPLARKRAEIAVVTFGGEPSIAVPFAEGRDLPPATFTAVGATPLGAAVELGLAQVLARKQSYKAAGLDYFRPWIFVISDGAPTDGAKYTAATKRLREEEARRGVTVFAVGVEGADMHALQLLSDKRDPLALLGLKFTEMFEWLSQSMSMVSQSTVFASDTKIYDAEPVDQDSEQKPLPPPKTWADAGWDTW